MIHHSSADYKVASGEAAKVGRQKMEEIIHRGHASAAKVIEDIQNRIIQDQVVQTAAIRILPQGTGWQMGREIGNDDGSLSDSKGLHDHAFDQIIGDAQVPKMFVNKIVQEVNGDKDGGGWGKDLIAHNVNTILSHRKDQRNLVRSENGQVKGWLSDRFRRLDSRPLLESFVMAAKQMDLIPIQGVGSETKCRLRAVLPQIFEPIKNEVMIFGLEWGNSDYGDGGHVVNLWTMRVYCSNLAVTEQCLRQIHLGKRLSDDIAYSQKTYELDTQTNASALRDITRHAIGSDRINRMLDGIAKAGEKEIEGKDVAALLKKHLEKADAEKVQELYDSHDNANMPEGKTVWRLSNAISWLAEAKDMSADRKLALQEAAGAMLPIEKHKAMEA